MDAETFWIKSNLSLGVARRVLKSYQSFGDAVDPHFMTTLSDAVDGMERATLVQDIAAFQLSSEAFATLLRRLSRPDESHQ